MTEEMITVTVPDWKQKSDKLNELLKTNPEAGEQVVYRSRQGLNDDPICVPELISERMEANSYPDVVTAPPADMVSPKYSWYGDTGWFENATQQQGTRIAGLEANIKTVSQSLDDLKKEKQTETDTRQKQDEKMNKLIKLVAMTNAQVGTLLGKPTGTTTISQPSQPTTTSAAQSTSPVTAQPTAPVTKPTAPVAQQPVSPTTQQSTASVTQSTAPVTAQPTQPSTTTEGGKK